jgi:nitrous oxidase accessory protein
MGALLLTIALPAFAATHCVNTAGAGGCYSSISAAVAAAAPGDTITVEQGTYNEDVTVTKSLSLVGANRENTVIDAAGMLNGITITNTRDVAVSGFTVENAETAGIWITGSTAITISDNIVLHNDLGLVPGNPSTCPPLVGTPFETG